MKEQNREQISALVDDEHTGLSDHTLNNLIKDDENRKVWLRYHLIGDSLRGNLPEKIDNSIVDRVSEAIKECPTILAPSRKIHSFFKPIAGFAIAASVAVMAVISVQHTTNNPAVTPLAPISIAKHQSEFTNPQLSRNVSVQSSKNQTNPLPVLRRIDADSSFSRYLMNHSEYRTNTGMQGMLPYVRIVAVEPKETVEPKE